MVLTKPSQRCEVGEVGDCGRGHACRKGELKKDEVGDYGEEEVKEVDIHSSSSRGGGHWHSINMAREIKEWWRGGTASFNSGPWLAPQNSPSDRKRCVQGQRWNLNLTM